MPRLEVVGPWSVVVCCSCRAPRVAPLAPLALREPARSDCAPSPTVHLHEHTRRRRLRMVRAVDRQTALLNESSWPPPKWSAGHEDSFWGWFSLCRFYTIRRSVETLPQFKTSFLCRPARQRLCAFAHSPAQCQDAHPAWGGGGAKRSFQRGDGRFHHSQQRGSTGCTRGLSRAVRGFYQQVGSATVTTRSDPDGRCTDTALLSAIAEALFTSTALLALLGVLVRRSLTCVLKIRGQ